MVLLLDSCYTYLVPFARGENRKVALHTSSPTIARNNSFNDRSIFILRLQTCVNFAISPRKVAPHPSSAAINPAIHRKDSHNKKHNIASPHARLHDSIHFHYVWMSVPLCVGLTFKSLDHTNTHTLFLSLYLLPPLSLD